MVIAGVIAGPTAQQRAMAAAAMTSFVTATAATR
jgi:hypothetical protein